MSIEFRFIIFLMLIASGTHAQTQQRSIKINEILFNPPKDGFDYVEIVNNGDEAVDLQSIMIGKRNVTGDISGAKQLSKTGLLLQPQQFAVVTGNEKWLKQQYTIDEDAVVCQLSSMLSLPDDEGSIVILSVDSTILDELVYNENWHFALISNKEGVALERLSANAPTQDKNNWTSASSSSGFGTPGMKNSQASPGIADPGREIVVSPDIFSPDNDGFNDLLMIRFQLRQPGFVVNTTVFDIGGRKVRSLIRNGYPGLSANYVWDGLDDQSRPMPQGAYILVTELFNLKGVTKKFRKLVTLARRQ